jgi:DNA-binding NarL/FixJ family response regulator
VPRLTNGELAKVRAIRAELDVVRTSGPPVMEVVTPALREALRTDKLAAFALRPRGEGLAVRWGHTDGFPRAVVTESFDAFLSGQGVDWTAYNPVRPEPSHRNRALRASGIAAVSGRSVEELPIVRFYSRHGLGGTDTLRAVICDGPSLLAWVGGWQADPYDAGQARVLSAVIPSLVRRLRVERQLADATRTSSALVAALQALGAPAFVIGPSGEVFEANTAGEALLAAQSADVRTSLHDAARKRPARVPFRLTPLAGPGEPQGYLAILDAERPAGSAIDRAVARYGLTPRQRQTLELVAAGKTNAAIGAELGISERTVELHVTGLLDKVGVDSRAALVGALLAR